MSETITLDKHEMVVDKEDFEALEKSHAELLEACKAYADKYFSRANGDLERLTPEARQILNVIAKAESRV